MKKLTNLKRKGTNLSKETMKKVNGGYSWFWCFTHSFDIPGIYDGPVGDDPRTTPGGMTWDECRAKKD